MKKEEKELKILHHVLYGRNEAAWKGLLEVMARGKARRGEDLRRQDRSRRARPNWYLDRSWLGMVTEQERRDRGLFLCRDFVMDHVEEDHPWVQRAKESDPDHQKYFFLFRDWEEPSRYEVTVPQACPVTAPGNFSACKETGQVVMTTFQPHQWDLNYAEPAVFNGMMESLLDLCNEGADLIRLQGLPYLWKTIGTGCRDLPQVHLLIRMVRLVCQVVCPGVLLLVEETGSPAGEAAYFGSEDRRECHLLWDQRTRDSLWHTVATRDVGLLEHRLRQVFRMDREQVFLNSLSLHRGTRWDLDYDQLKQWGMEKEPHVQYLNAYLTGQGWDSDARGELYMEEDHPGEPGIRGTLSALCGIQAALEGKELYKLAHAVRLDIMLQAFLLTLRGIPLLHEASAPEQGVDRILKDEVLPAQKGGGASGNSKGKKKGRTGKEEATPEGRIAAALKQLLALRARHRVFDHQADLWVTYAGDRSILGIGRYYKGEKLVALFNFSDGLQSASVNELGDFVDALTGEPVDKASITLAAGDFAWLLCDFEKTAE